MLEKQEQWFQDKEDQCLDAADTTRSYIFKTSKGVDMHHLN